MLSGDNGILTRAGEARLATEIGTYKEQVSLAALNVKAKITSNTVSRGNYIATTSENIEILANGVAKDLGITVANKIGTPVEIASANGIDGLEIAEIVGNGTGINTEGYTVAYTLDANAETAENGIGHGYIIIWYTSNGLRSSIDTANLKSKYNIAKTIDGDISKNEATLVSVINVENYNSELATFTDTGATTGLTSTTVGNSDITNETFTANSKLDTKYKVIGSTTPVTPDPEPDPEPATVAVTGVTLNKTSIILDVGGTETLIATVAPSNATNKTVTWSAKDSSIATVSNGTVTAVAVGITTVTATCEGKSATCVITVINNDGTDSSYSGSSLALINDDYRAWLTVDDTQIDYPVVQGLDNLYYASHDVYKNASLTGAIFLAFENSGDFSDEYNMVFGHHMDQNIMFGNLDRYFNEDYLNEHRTGKLITDMSIYYLNVLAVKQIAYSGDPTAPFITDDGSFDHGLFYPGASAYDIASYLSTDAEYYNTSIDPENVPKILCLQTPASAITNGRLLVFFTMTEKSLF